MYRLDAQSASGDEIATLFYDAPDASTFWQNYFIYGREKVPPAYVMQYWCNKWAGGSIYVARLCAVLASLCAIGVLYALAQQLYGPAIALIAALCMALSPSQIYYGQAIGPYAFVVLFSLLSLYTFVRGVKSHSRWWWGANILMNMMVVWVHMAAVFFVVTEGILLCWTERRHIRRVLYWALAHVPLAVSVLWWVYSRPTFDLPGYYDFFYKSSFGSMFFDLFADDALCWNVEFLSAALRLWEGAPQSWAGYAGKLGYGLVAVNILGAAYLAARFIRGAVTGKSDALIFGLWLIPVLVLGVLSHVWRPYCFPRYTLYTMPALYLFSACLSYSFPKGFLRGLAIIVVAFIYAIQGALTIWGTTHTDWRSLARHVRDSATSEDLVLIGGDVLYPFYFVNDATPNIPVLNLPYQIDKQPEMVAKTARQYLNTVLGEKKTGAPVPSVWLAYVLPYEPGPLPGIETALKDKGLIFTFCEFLGGEHLKLYRIQAEGVNSVSLPQHSVALRRIARMADFAPAREFLRKESACGNFLMGTLTPLFANASDKPLLKRVLARLTSCDLLQYTGMWLAPASHSDIPKGILGLLEHGGRTITQIQWMDALLLRELRTPRLQTRQALWDFLEAGALTGPTAKDVSYWYEKGIMLGVAEDYAAASKAFETATTLAPQEVTAWTALASSYMHMRKENSARTALEEACLRSPELREFLSSQRQATNAGDMEEVQRLQQLIEVKTGASLDAVWYSDFGCTN